MGDDQRKSTIICLQEELERYDLMGKWNDYIGVQKEVIEVLRKEDFFEKNGVVTGNSGITVRITAKGVKETLGTGKRFQALPKALKELKVVTIRYLPILIENSWICEDNVENIHKKDGVHYAYLAAIVNVDGIEYGVRISVQKKMSSNVFWIHHIDYEKKTLPYSTLPERKN
ncbi:MAG: hypothetical protein E7260_06095 [Lachnospiraceae bacterium]|nr:hypothetical protein [Lachnospiraceae bacterium]